MTITETERESLLAIIHDQLRRYPKMRNIDLYKLLYQATFGGEHLLDSEAEARKILKAEWSDLEKMQKGEVLLEPIDPRGEIMRINLRVYRKTGGTPQALFSTFKKSTKGFKKDEQRLNDYFKICIDAAGRGELPFQQQELEDLYIEVGRQGFPPKHHSKAYAENHKPAYRIILKSLWDGFNENKE